MKIALVDDDAAFLEEFQRLLSLNPREKGITVVSFSSSNAFLSAPLASFDAFFLDVYVDEKDGISLARILRKEMTNPLIVFVTSSGDKAVDAFALDAVHYLVKPLDANKLEEALGRIQNELEAKERKVVFESKDSVVSLRLSDLIYIESFGNDKYFKLADKSFSLRRSTQELLELLKNDPRFYLLSRSYIVNFSYVEGLKGYFLELKNGEKIPFPRERKREVSEAFLAYLQS